jgi:hypothetical protein
VQALPKLVTKVSGPVEAVAITVSVLYTSTNIHLCIYRTLQWPASS